MSLQNQIDILACAMKEFNHLIQQTNCECKCTYKTFNSDSKYKDIEYYVRCTSCNGVNGGGGCDVCGGDGKCYDCGGDGKIGGDECYTCGGDGKCYDCGGDGKCYDCGGDGKIGGKNCNKCDGSGNCNVCGGDGVVDTEQPCPECCGKCYNCGGNGKIGSEKCDKCNGIGRCPKCDGDGVDGTKQCSECCGKCIHCHKRMVEKNITICESCLDTGYSLIDEPVVQEQHCQICGKSTTAEGCKMDNEYENYYCKTYEINIDVNKIVWLNGKLLCDQCGGNKCDSCKKTVYCLKPCDTCNEFEAYGLTKCINGYQKCSCCQGIAALKPTNYRCVSCRDASEPPSETHDIKEHICKECAYDAYNIPLFFNINTINKETTYSISINPLKIDKINSYNITMEDVNISNATIKIPKERKSIDQERLIKIDGIEYNICIKNNQLCYTRSDEENIPLELEFHNVKLHTNN
jgi:hypothetical protein